MMSLDKWAEQTIDYLQGFTNHWRRKHKQNPAEYPAEMDGWNWDTRFWDWDAHARGANMSMSAKTIVASLNEDEIVTRLSEICSEEKALKVLLRAVRRRR